MFKWFRYLSLENQILEIRKSINFELPNWFVFNLPDGLWIFSYTFMMLKIWNYKFTIKSLFWILLMPLIAITSEFLQYFHILCGTFDLLDLIFYLLGTSLPLLLTNRRNFINIKYI